MIKCETLRAKIPEATCIKRQDILSQDLSKIKNNANRRQHKLYTEDCLGCPIGRELLNESKGGKVKEVIKKKPIIKTWTCTTCKEEKELNNENFHIRRNSKTGFTAVCKECRNKRKRERRSLQGGNIPENCIMLDLTGHSNLHKKIKEWAGDNMRDVDKQILFHLKHDALGKRKAV